MNREVVSGGGATIYPLTGDIQSTPGNTLVTVTGIQSVPFLAKSLQGGEVPMYDPNSHQWTPLIRAAIQLNGVTISDDNDIGVNLPGVANVNGSPVG